MNISILTDNPKSWIKPYVKRLISRDKLNTYSHFYSVDHLAGGDLLIILSCEKKVADEILSLFTKAIVVHPSKLPQGRGWSPIAWDILSGSSTIYFTLFEAISDIDSGDIYLTDKVDLNGTELNSEIKEIQGSMTVKMVEYFIQNIKNITPTRQHGEASYYKRRGKSSSELNPHLSIKDQFNLLRVVDNERYPAFFFLNGQKYIIKIFKGDA